MLETLRVLFSQHITEAIVWLVYSDPVYLYKTYFTIAVFTTQGHYESPGKVSTSLM